MLIYLYIPVSIGTDFYMLFLKKFCYIDIYYNEILLCILLLKSCNIQLLEPLIKLRLHNQLDIHNMHLYYSVSVNYLR